MLGWRTVGVAAAEKLLRLRLPAKPTEHEWKGMLKGKLTKKAKEEKPADWFDTPTWSLWSTIPRSKIPTFATVAVSYAGRRKASVARSKKAYEKVWMRVIQKVFGSDCGTAGGGSGAVGDEPVGALKEKVATLPILDVSLPLMDNATGTVRGGTKSDFLDAVWVPKPPDRPPTAQGDAAAGFSAIVVDFSAAMVKVCATLKGRKDRITFGDVVDSALAFALDRARRANASTAYLAIDPYPPEGDDDAAEEKLSVKRWVHLCRAENRIRARKYGSIDADTVIEGGAGKVMDVLTWSSNKRKVMELAYTRLAELCLKSEFLHDGEAVAWVGDKPNNYFHCATATGGVTASTVPELQSTSPEADFKFAAAIEHWLSAGGTTDSRPIAVWVEDTDVVTHVLTHFWRRCIGKDIEADAIPGIAFMRERKSRSTYQHVGDIVKGLEERLGYDAAHTVLDVLHQAHVISGCDYTSFVAAKKKKTFWNVLTAMARHSRLRSVLITGLGKLSAEDATVGVGLERHVATDVMDAVETFWACLHLPTAALEKVGKSAEDVPLPQLHTARTVADPNFLDGEAFPLSRVELEEHALRSAYVLTQFRVGTNTPRTALTHSSAVGWGFHIDEDGYRRRRRGRLLGRRRCTTDARNDRWPSGGGCSSVQPPN